MSQIDLFGDSGDAAAQTGIAPAQADPALLELAAVLPPQLRLGTSSWSFPGWAGIVYDHRYPAARLSRDGLHAYSRHPLLRTVGLDSSFYQPLPAEKLRHWSAQVPETFRFLVKAARQVTSPWQWDASGRMTGRNSHFLSVDFALERVIDPLLEGMGDRLGTLLWQFPPLGREITADPRRFAERLYRFLHRLPVGPVYSVELRDAELLGDDLVQALHHGGGVPSLSVHPRLPELAWQQRHFAALADGPLVIRWMLRRDRRYEEAKADFSPFDHLQAEDPNSRLQIAAACRTALQAGRDVFVIANNKAEGSSPLSLAKLASAIVQGPPTS